MLDALKVIILGIVEGITEWLPISSTGHLILMNELLSLDQEQAFIDMFNVVIQLGAIMAVVVLYFPPAESFLTEKDGKAEKTHHTALDQSRHRLYPRQPSWGSR